ncbi:MAG TPA: hypothetical protein VN813_08730 [Luteibacter sp.]|jgi:hypothetical protein|nr:hypothetical protein [Luteibacter sp.]
MHPRTTPTHDCTDGSPVDELRTGSEARSLLEMMCVFGERMRHLATRTEVGEIGARVAVIEDRMERLATKAALAVFEERMSHTATKTWVLGGVITILAGLLGAVWWIVQQYLAPLLRALPAT